MDGSARLGAVFILTGIIGAIVGAVINLFLAFFIGGYVANRMASRSGAKHGLFVALPALIGAVLILSIGFIIARVLQGIATKVLESIGFEGWMEKGGIKQFFDRSQTQQTPLSILGKLVFWLVFFIAITMVADTLGLSALSDVLAQFIAYIPQIIAAILILVLATLVANFVAGSVAQYGIIVFAAFGR